MYADKMTAAIKNTIAITERRRKQQQEYNEMHGIIPKTVQREITLLVEPEPEEVPLYAPRQGRKEMRAAEQPREYLTEAELLQKIQYFEAEMKKAAKELRFEDAAHYRDRMRKYQEMELALG